MAESNPFGTELPIIQAPMAGVQASALAVAVCNSGGLGSLPCAMLTVDGMRNELAALAGQSQRPWNVNFFCHQPAPADEIREQAWRAALTPYYREFGIDPATLGAGAGRAPFNREALALLAEVKPKVVSFHFGLPAADLVHEVKQLGAMILSSATTVAEARWLEQHGADVIIAQGVEAGGHRGMFLSTDLSTQLGTMALLPQVVKAVRVPVVAAGGISDARAVQAALSLGASAVQVGTTYLLCDEATTSKPHRAALSSPAAEHTALTNLFTGRPARGIVNRFMRELGPMSHLAPAFPMATAAMAPLRLKAEAAGSGDFSPLWSGQNATGCKAVGAAQLTRELAGI